MTYCEVSSVIFSTVAGKVNVLRVTTPVFVPSPIGAVAVNCNQDPDLVAANPVVGLVGFAPAVNAVAVSAIKVKLTNGLAEPVVGVKSNAVPTEL